MASQMVVPQSTTRRRIKGCVHNQQFDRSDLSDEIDPVRWKRMRSSNFITVTHTITSLIP